MKHRQSAADEAFEMLLKESADLAAEEMGKSYEEPPEYEPSPEFDVRIEKLFARERRKKRLRRMASISKRAACVLLVFVIAFSVAIGSVEAWRVKFLNFVFDPDKPNMDIVFGDKGTHYADDDISIDYLPLGFELSEKSTTRFSVVRLFKNKEERIRVGKYDESINANVDTEDSTIEEIEINGYSAALLIKNNRNILFWSDGDYIFVIDGNVSKKEIIKIAENIK